MLANNNKIINRIAYGEANPMGGVWQEYSCELINQMNTLDNAAANGSITTSQNITHDNIYGNTARAAQASGRRVRKNPSSSTTKGIHRLTELLSFTKDRF